MIKTLIWQLRQFFVPYPAVDSWAYNFKTWWHYDRHIPPVEDTTEPTYEIKIKGIEFPTTFDSIEFSYGDDEQNVKVAGIVMRHPQAFSSAINGMNAAAKVVREFGISIEEVTLKVRELKEAQDDYNASSPEGWVTVYAFDDPDTLIGLVDPDGRVHDVRDIIPIDDPDDPDSV